MMGAFSVALRSGGSCWLRSSSLSGLSRGVLRWRHHRDLSSGGQGSKLEIIKHLREETGAPITEVKSALQGSDWDIEKAHVELRKRGIAQAEKKKLKRTAAEGLVGVWANGSATKAALVEVNCETDFVSRNESFQQLVGQAARALLRSSLECDPSGMAGSDISQLKTEDDATVGEVLTDVGLSVREKLELRRGHVLEASNGVVATYLHASPAPSVGSIGALVRLESGDGAAALQEDQTSKILDLGRKIAMHVAATSPKYLDEAQVPADVIEAERDVLRNQPGVSEKPENIAEKIIAGRMHKLVKQITLVNQPFVMDDSKTVGEYVKAEGGAMGLGSLEVSEFVRFKVGEGIEKKTKSFAEEVADLQ